jgi:predicted kinase
VIVQMAGLPGTGKSTLAAHLARELGGVVLDKDHVRYALFTGHVDYSREQDDLCVEVLLKVAEYLLRRDADAIVILDGCTCSRAYQVERVRRFARRTRQSLHLIECVCSGETARGRLDYDAAAGRHLAANRDFSLHQRIDRQADPIPEPKLVMSTDSNLPDCVTRCLDYLRTPGLAVPPALEQARS